MAVLPRHLRRRAGSHKPYNGHRFRPNAKLQGKRRKLEPEAATDSAEGEAVEQGGAAPACEQQAEAAVATRPFTNRRMRRQPALLQQQHRESAAWTEAALTASAAAGASPSSSSALRRLETHTWHAKRLAMEER